MNKKVVEFLRFDRKELEDIKSFQEKYINDLSRLRNDVIQKFADEIKTDISDLTTFSMAGKEFLVYNESIIGTIHMFFTEQHEDNFIRNKITAVFTYTPTPKLISRKNK